ncbi:alpha/beta hydrolase [Pseudoblastomonas halimionae]|uniref:Alpha/beta fold hydrolase n=1 Tax=Alteriqipengyuania halimionae TaxID=1926630 RepID=A0A6I4U705_9SPHN|nr:alpha/beta hydrolase [Alteriqipengyuania halimionae]MXP11214.1 alpha/beta fold hydrolase [Alteriqipengyuania halimionae]
MTSGIGITTFGRVTVWYDGQIQQLPSSRKTRALLAYLLTIERPASRQELCSLLWDMPDDPRGALRWSLSKLRPIINAGSQERLRVDRDTIEIDRSDISVDVDSLHRLRTDPGTDVQAMAAAWKLTNRSWLEDCELPNLQDYSIWLERERHEIEGLRASLTRRLAQSPSISAAERELWADRWLGDAPLDPDAAKEAVDARRRAGRPEAAQSLAGELEANFRDAGVKTPEFTAAPQADTNRLPPRSSLPPQKVGFIKTADDVSIGWAITGDRSNPPLVKAANWLSHLELDWEAPIWSPLFRRLSDHHCFVRYDERGCGLSDWDVPDISQESFVADLEAVVEASGLERFPLLGISQGAAVSIEYAARHPERVSHLILFGGYDRGWRLTATEEEQRVREAVMTLTETGWGVDNAAIRQIYAHTMMPTANSAEMSWFNDFQRQTTSATNAVRFLEAFSQIDVSNRLAEIRCPTLVIHSRGDVRIPLETGRALAAKIPDARFATLETDNHLLLGREPASAEFVRLVTDFIAP